MFIITENNDQIHDLKFLNKIFNISNYFENEHEFM